VSVGIGVGVGVGVVGVLALGAAIWFWRKSKANKNSATPAEMEQPGVSPNGGAPMMQQPYNEYTGHYKPVEPPYNGHIQELGGGQPTPTELSGGYEGGYDPSPNQGHAAGGYRQPGQQYAELG
jgi:hypothetical protein